jgi:hypothetical protein
MAVTDHDPQARRAYPNERSVGSGIEGAPTADPERDRFYAYAAIHLGKPNVQLRRWVDVSRGYHLRRSRGHRASRGSSFGKRLHKFAGRRTQPMKSRWLGLSLELEQAMSPLVPGDN